MKTILQTTLFLSVLSFSNLFAQLVPAVETAVEEGIFIAFKLNPEGKLQGRLLQGEEAVSQTLEEGDAISARSVSSDPRVTQLEKGSEEVVIRVTSPLRLRAGGNGPSRSDGSSAKDNSFTPTMDYYSSEAEADMGKREWEKARKEHLADTAYNEALKAGKSTSEANDAYRREKK